MVHGSELFSSRVTKPEENNSDLSAQKMTTNSPILLFSFIVCSFLVCLTLTLANHQRYHVTTDYRSSETGKEAIVYEVYARSWLQQLSEEYGRPITRLTDIPRHDLQKLHDQKITTVWLQGVWQLQQPYPLKGSFGPHFPYYQFDFANGVDAVVDYVCNPKVGTDADLAAFKKKLNSVGLSLMLDFIPNHSSSNSPWVHSNPDLYVLLPTKNVSVVYDRNAFLPNGVAHGRDPLFAPWTNTAQWNCMYLCFHLAPNVFGIYNRSTFSPRLESRDKEFKIATFDESCLTLRCNSV